MHTVIQVPLDAVVGSRNGCCHPFEACTVDVTAHSSRQTVSALTPILYSQHPANCILPILVRKLAATVIPATTSPSLLRFHGIVGYSNTFPAETLLHPVSA